MKLSLRNLAMGAAIAVSSLAFAQEMPFTVTENFSRFMTGADFGLSSLGVDMRSGTGHIDGKFYTLNKATGQIFAVTGDAVTEYRTIDANHEGLVPDICLTADDAGNLLAFYGKSWYTPSMYAIIPADPAAEVIYQEMELPEGFTLGRCDVAGRVVGDMLSADGAYLYLFGAGSADATVGCIYIAEGYAEPVEYPSNPFVTAGSNLSTAVPAFSTIEEQSEADPIYNAAYLAPWNSKGLEYLDGDAGKTVGRPEGLFYSSTPGSDLFTYEGKRYFAVPYSQLDGKRTGDFVIYDEELNIIFKTENPNAETIAGGNFINGGGLFIHPVSKGVFQLSWMAGANQGATIATYTIRFAGSEPVEPEAPFTVTEKFSRFMTGADFGLSSLGVDMRSGTGHVDGKFYTLNKATGQIFAITGDAVTEYRTIDANHEGLVPDICLTADDAGNLLAFYGKSWYTPSMYAIIPADPAAEVIYQEMELPEGFTLGRSDVAGRVVGDMLSEDGAYLYLFGAGSADATVGCIYIAEGYAEPVEYPSNPFATAGSNLSTAVPAFSTIEEQSEADPIYNAAYLAPWNANGLEYLDGDAAKTVGRPEGLAYSSTPGADVFTYNGKRYFAVPYTQLGGKRTGDFVIYDEELNIIFKTENPNAEAIAGGSFINGGGLFIHPVSEGVFQLSWMAGANQGATIAVYEINFGGEVVPPVPADPAKIYLVGEPTGWTEPSEANAATYADWALTETAAGSGIYNGKFEVAPYAAQFRFFTTLGGWDAEQFGAQAEDSFVDVKLADNAFEGAIVAGKGSLNFINWIGGVLDITVDLNAKTVKVAATPELPELYVRGEFNEWGTTVKMEAPAEANAEGLYVYTATIENLAAGEFKVGSEDWRVSYGIGAEAPAIENGKAVDAWFNGNNYTFAGEKNVTVTLAINPDRSVASALTLAWEVAKPARNNYAYAIAMTDEGEGKYVITYKSTGAAEATLIVTGEEGQFEYPMGEAVAGDNSFTFTSADLKADKNYTFAISIKNEAVAAAPALVFEGEKFELPTRGGMVVINDPESDAFGMAVTCAGKAQGMQLYDQNLQFLGQFHNGYEGWNAGNQSSPFRGAEREGVAVFGDYSDGGANYYVFDPQNPTELGTMLGAPATKAASGLWTLNGVEIAGGNSGLAFRGRGENTQMFTVIEDNTEHPNCLAQYDLGSATMIEVAPVKWFTAANAMLPNHNVEIALAQNGMFISQIRSNVEESSVCRMLYVDFEDDVKASWWNDVIPNACGAVAITADEKILAVGSQSEILFFEIAFNEETNVPTLTPLADWTVKLASDFSEYRFDVAGNLYVYSNKYQGMQVYALPLGKAAVTPAKSVYVIKGKPTGVEDVAVDAEAEAIYYTIGGVQVAAEDLTPGVYVKVVGNTATKVVVK